MKPSFEYNWVDDKIEQKPIMEVTEAAGQDVQKSSSSTSETIKEVCNPVAKFVQKIFFCWYLQNTFIYKMIFALDWIE